MKIRSFLILFVAIMVLLAVNACNRNKNNMATTPQVEEQTFIPEETILSSPQMVEETPLFEFSDGIIIRYNGNETSVVIPTQIQGQAVIRINAYAFSGQDQLTSISIGESIELGSWDENVFWTDNKHMSAFSNGFDDVYNYMGKAAGTYTVNNGIWSSPTLDIPVFFIQSGVITKYNGTAISVIIPSEINGQTVTEIGERVFYGKQLTSVTIPDSVATIRECAFQNNQLTNITIPDSVTKIEGNAFNSNQLTSITIGANVELGSWDKFQGSEFYYVFSNAFDTAYNEGGKQAGTYPFIADVFESWG